MLLLFLEILAAGIIVFGLYTLRRHLGLSLLFIFVGSNQFVQNLVSATIFQEVLGRFPVSPGSAALFSSTLLALLLIYLKEGVPTARRLIYGIILANLGLTLYVSVVRWGLLGHGLYETSSASDWFRTYDLSLHAMGTALLLVDAFVLLIVFESLASKAKWLPVWVRSIVALCLVLSFDSVAFVTFGLADQPNVTTLLIGQLLGKNLAGVVYGVMLGAYFSFGGSRAGGGEARIRDPLSIFTYRERYQQLVEESARLEKEREVERQHAEVAARGAGLGLWSWNVQTGETSLDDTWAEMLGHTRAEVVPTIDSWEQRIHPDDRAQVERTLSAHLAGDSPSYESEHRLRKKSGDWKWILSIGQLIERDEDGQPLRMSGAHLDIGRRKKVEMALRESEHRYELATEAARVGVWDWNLETDDIYVDPRLKGLLGYEDSEIQNRLDDWGSHVHPEDAAAVAEQATAHLEGKTPRYEVEHRMIHKDGSVRWFLAQGTALKSREGKPLRVIGTDTDITDAKLAQAELDRLEQRYRTLFELAPLMYVITGSRDGEPYVRDCNVAFLNALGYSREEIVGRPLGDFYSPESRQKLIDQGGFARVLDGELVEAERQLVTRAGELVETMMRAVPETDEEGRKVGSRAMYVDLTERKQAENRLMRSRKQLRLLAARLEAIREEERTAAGREIHDELGQALTGLKMDLGWVGMRLTEQQSKLRHRVRSMGSLVDQLVDAVRDLSARLRPAVLDDLGLRDAIEWQVRDFGNRSGITCILTQTRGNLPLSSEQKTAVFRILQEALTNVARHAEAHKVDVVLKRTGGGLVLEVTDDGKGIAPEEVLRDSSLGLLGMRERAEALGGRLQIGSLEVGGTKVAFEIPV